MISEETMKMWMLENNGGILYDSVNKGVFTGYVTFTPERSAMALDANKRNRKYNERNLSILKESFVQGHWNDNVSVINFTSKGMLDDGQHRIRSALETGTTFRTKVTYGVEEGTQHFTDRRGTRTLTDDISIDGFKSAPKLAAITRILYLRDEKKLSAKAILNKGFQNSVPDITLYKYFLDRSEEVAQLVNSLASIYVSLRGLDINREIVNVLGIEFSRISADDAEAFWKHLRDGVYTDENDPVKRLRERLVKNEMSRTNKMPKLVMAALIIKAWNYYESGETIKCLKYTSGGANPEAFPEIYDPYMEDQ